MSNSLQTVNTINRKVYPILKAIEMEHDVYIIYAVDRGSRAKNIQSEISDYDIKFIFG